MAILNKSSKTTKYSPKTVELIIYISSSLKDKPNYGPILLAKSLFMIDWMNYLKKGEPLTIFRYIKQQPGPTPDPSQFLPMVEYLIDKGDLTKINARYFGSTQLKYLPRREPQIEVFEKDELMLINDFIESICDPIASDLSDYIHNSLAWIIAYEGEELPFYSLLLKSKEPEEKDYKWAEKALKAYEASSQK